MEASWIDTDERSLFALFFCWRLLLKGRHRHIMQERRRGTKRELRLLYARAGYAMHLIPTIGAGRSSAAKAEVAHAHKRRFTSDRRSLNKMLLSGRRLVDGPANGTRNSPSCSINGRT